MAIARLIADVARLESRVQQADAVIIGHGIEVMEGAGGVEGVVQLSGPSVEGLHESLDDLFPDFDWLCSEESVRTPQLLVSDMDSTMIGQECIDELADYAGIKDQIAAITERAMLGELDFEAALRERVALLAGLPESAIDRCLAERIRPNPGARELVQGLKAKGARAVLVTGGFHHFADAVGEQIGFDRVVGNRLAVKDGVLTGGLEGPVSDANTKARVLAEEASALGRGATTLAIGDGANDIPMIKAATYGFAYCAKPKANEAADGRITSGDLAKLLPLLNIARD
ncbi:MAG: phosphoserine phosphatase SerB [Pseudomonadota bacterium]